MKLLPHAMVVALAIGSPVCAAPAIGQASKPDPKPNVTPAKKDADKIVCRTFPVTGSLVQTKRLCAPQHDWDLAYQLRRESTGGSCAGASPFSPC